MADDAGGAHGQAPIIIKKKVVGGHGHHGGAWKVAYADMVTAMMALFIVLWILAQSDDIKESVSWYFRDPVGFKEGGMPTIQQGAGSGNEIAIMDDVPPRSDKGSDTDGRLSGGNTEETAREQAEQIKAELAKLPEIEKFQEQIEFTVTPEGLRVNLLESTDTPMFQLGGTELNDEALALLKTLGKAILDSGTSVVIEGHTDATPFAASSSRSNWELSTGRAHTARRVFEGAGVPGDRFLEVRGFAEKQLYNPLDPMDSRNRRVSITLLSESALDNREVLPDETLIPWLDNKS